MQNIFHKKLSIKLSIKTKYKLRIKIFLEIYNWVDKNDNCLVILKRKTRL